MNAADTAVQSRPSGSASTAKGRRSAMLLVLVFACVSFLPPLLTRGCTLMDFRAIYMGTRCLISHHNPYVVSELNREYRTEDGPFPADTSIFHQNLTLYVNVPTTFVLLAPFALMPWAPAHLLWMLLSTAVFMLALLLMWREGAKYSLEIATLLTCAFAVNCESGFYTGNTADIVIGLCVIAVWCFLRNRLVWAGVLCMAVSIAVKPHDSGFVWLYFLLAGGVYRKRALQSLGVTAAIALAAALWVGHVAPHWLQDWHANLVTIESPGGINDPGPKSIQNGIASNVVDLQTAISMFRDDARFYNRTSYLVCGLLLLAWMVRTVRSRLTVERAFLALSAVSAITMLITYHRLWDAKLVMLAIPAGCMLCARGGRLGKAATLITLLTIVLGGDLTMASFTLIFEHLHPGMDSIGGEVLNLLILRPVSLALLGMGGFYLWIYLRPPVGVGDEMGEVG